MGAVIGEMPGDAGEQVLVGFARHQVSVFQRLLAELRQQAVAAAVEHDADAALVLIDLIGMQVRQQRRRAVGIAVAKSYPARTVHLAPPHTTSGPSLNNAHYILWGPGHYDRAFSLAQKQPGCTRKSEDCAGRNAGAGILRAVGWRRAPRNERVCGSCEFGHWPSRRRSVTASARRPQRLTSTARSSSRRKCTICHRLDETGKKKVGPNLWGVVGRPIASAPGFKYSKGLGKHAGKTWTEDNLNAWLTKPRAFAKGTRMAFPGFRKAGQRAVVIAYLRSAVQ